MPVSQPSLAVGSGPKGRCLRTRETKISDAAALVELLDVTEVNLFIELCVL